MSYRITPATLDILELLARYRYLRKSFLDGLLPERSTQGMNRTLKRMVEAGLIAKPRAQYRGYNNLYCCYIYEIAPKGAHSGTFAQRFRRHSHTDSGVFVQI